MVEPGVDGAGNRSQACRVADLSQPDACRRPAAPRVRAPQRVVPRGRAEVASRMLVQRTKRGHRSATGALPASAAKTMTGNRHHLDSLDVMRGMSVAAMI